MKRVTYNTMWLSCLLSITFGLALRAAEPAPDAAAGPEIIPFPNGSFDEGEAHWFFSRERGTQTRATAEYCFTPPGALRIYADKDKGIGARVDSALIPVQGPGLLELRAKVCAFSGRMLGMWVRQYDAEKKLLPVENFGEPARTGGKWKALVREVLLDEKAAYVQVRLLSYPADGEVIDMFFDDFELVRPAMPIPPWPSQYKLRPGDTEKLTAADVVGPDGIVYPNWTQVGVQGGIPEVPVKIKLSDLGAKPDSDIADLLEQACRDAGAQGGGAVLIEAGTYFLGRPVTIRHSGVVIRGAGRDQTRLIFNYAVGTPEHDIGFAWPDAGGTVGPDTQVEAHAFHRGLKRLVLFRDGKAVQEQGMDGAWSYALKVSGADLLKAGGPGTVGLRVEAEYLDGRKVSVERQVTLTEEAQPVKEWPRLRAALFFTGGGLEETDFALAADGQRGDTALLFQDAGDLQVGQRLELHAPGTLRFKELTQHLAGGDDWKRIGFYEILAKDGNRVTINQPLRIDFPVIDGTYARRLDTVERCGVESLTIEHTCRLPVHSIMFDWGWNGWIRDVKVTKSGSNGAYAERSKWIEIRDCELDGSWNNDGGQAYAGFTSCADSLFENCVVRKYRHGPVVQYGAMGNVFRNSIFEGSDLQWHAGWSTENLFENCTVKSFKGSGSYGYGAYATGSSDVDHGPNGPRNVVYNCDIASALDGVKLDGVNEHWLFLHNRFVVGKGAGFVATRGSFDHIIRNNVFILKDGASPMVRLHTPDCVGIELIGNTLVGGNGKTLEGAAALAMDQGNKDLPAWKPGEALPNRPTADPPSIYEWQNRKQ